MQKYIDADHVEEVPPAEFTPLRPNHAWWIPVFSVTHPKKKKFVLFLIVPPDTMVL